VGVAVVLLFVLAHIAVTPRRLEAPARTFSFQVGAAVISIPLLAYVGVAAGYAPALVGGVLTDVGHNAGTGLFSHLRVLIVVPLTVALVVCDRESTEVRSNQRVRRPWRVVEAEFIEGAAQVGGLEVVIGAPLRRHMAALAPEQRREVAARIARRLARRYRVPRSPAGPQVTRPELAAALAIAERAASGRAAANEIAQARGIAERIAESSARVRPSAATLRRGLAGAIQTALGHDTGDVDATVAAILAETESASRPYIKAETRRDDERSRATATYHEELIALLDDLGTAPRFTPFQDPFELELTAPLALTPAYMIPRERRRWGLIQPLNIRT
jgi:hypothetical protein